jgi:uncharacterized protein YkwD
MVVAVTAGAAVIDRNDTSVALSSTGPSTSTAGPPVEPLPPKPTPPAKAAPPARTPTTTPTAAPSATPTTATTARPATTTPTVRPTVTTARPATTVRPTPTQPPASGNTAADALALMNRDRTTHGLPALPVRADAQAKAQAWAEKLAADGRLSHSNLSQGISQCYSGIGENVAMAPSVSWAEQILMDDPPHRANILGTKWTAAGVGVARTTGGFMVVQVFVTGC